MADQHPSAVAYLEGTISFEDALSQISRTAVDRDWLARVLVHLAELRERSSPALSAHDAKILAESGLTVDSAKAAAAIIASARDRQRVLEQSLTVDDAASRMASTPGHIRELLAARSLWAFAPADGSGPRIPAAQFTDDGLVPHLDTVIGLIPASIDPLAFHRLLTITQPDLVLAGQPASIISWLAASGGDPHMLTKAADLARGLTAW